MNPVSQPGPVLPNQPSAQPSPPTTIDVVSAPAQTIPVRQASANNPFSFTPAPPQPANLAPAPAPVAATPSPQAAPAPAAQKPKRSLKHLWPAAAALVAALILATAAFYAFKAANKPATNPASDQSQAAAAEAKPITSSDLDQLSQSFGNLSNLDDAQDFSADALSNQAFGF